MKNAQRIKVRPATADEHMVAVSAMLAQIEMDLTNLPFPLLKVPPLVEAHQGDWSLQQLTSPPVSPGYYRAMARNPEHERFWMLTEKTDEKGIYTVPGKLEPIEANKAKIWMSIAAMELESQAQGVHEAKGDVLVGGLGMGCAAYNLLLKPEVTRVLVIEKNPLVIEMMAPSLAKWWSDSPVAHRRGIFTVQQGDILHPKKNMKWRTFDYALIDIWPFVGDTDLRPDMLSIMNRYPAKVYGAWGIELDFITWCIDQEIPYETAMKLRGLYSAYRENVYGFGCELVGENYEEQTRLAFTAATVQALNSIR